MSRQLIVLTFIVVMAVAASWAYAQDGAPGALIDRAVADLSTRAGQPVTLEMLDQWTWTQVNYPDSSLGCAQPGQAYEQGVTAGYQIRFTMVGATFDYRGTADAGIFFLCSGPGAVPVPDAQATTAPDAAPPAEGDVSRMVCDGAMNTRLDTGFTGTVIASVGLNMRAAATTTSAQVGELPPNSAFEVIGGPQCAENYVWWQVNAGGGTGWVAEGAAGVYWLEPAPGQVPPATATPTQPVVTLEAEATTPVPQATTTPAALPATPTPPPPQVFILPDAGGALTVENVSQVESLVDIPLAERLLAAAWSPDGQTLALTTASGLQLYDLAALADPPRLLLVPDAATDDVTFNADGTLIATGHTNGTVRVWDTSTGGLRAVLRGHTAPVQAVAFSPTEPLIASASGGPESAADSAIRLWDAETRSELAVLEGHTGPVTALVFSPDGRWLASGGVDNSVRLWDTETYLLDSTLSHHGAPVRALAFSPDGSWLLSADDDGIIHMLELEVGTERFLEGQTGPVTRLAVSPDGLLLASAGEVAEDAEMGPVVIWDLGTGEIAGSLVYEDAAEQAIVDIMFGPEGTGLAVASSDDTTGLLRIWGVAP